VYGSEYAGVLGEMHGYPRYLTMLTGFEKGNGYYVEI
jgi:hypothetical protein